jgi:hypothetical protein
MNIFSIDSREELALIKFYTLGNHRAALEDVFASYFWRPRWPTLRYFNSRNVEFSLLRFLFMQHKVFFFSDLVL